jgi:hypothetical protein
LQNNARGKQEQCPPITHFENFIFHRLIFQRQTALMITPDEAIKNSPLSRPSATFQLKVESARALSWMMHLTQSSGAYHWSVASQRDELWGNKATVRYQQPFIITKTETNCVHMYAPRARSITFVEEEEET